MLARHFSSALLALATLFGCDTEEEHGDGFAGSNGAGAASALATIAPFGTGTVSGTAAFTQTGADVSVTVTLSNCPDGPHGVHIHQGISCADPVMQGDHWDMTRGEMIPDVMCAGGTGSSTHTRIAASNPALAWSIGGDPLTNVIGHAVVVHDPGMPAPRIGCGLITAQ
jgi:Cu-Zn family superoxide dismutase